MLFTRRGLLLWHLPSYGRRNARRTPRGFLPEMWIGPALAVVLAVVLVFVPAPGSADWPFVVPVLVLWLVSPLVGWWISRPLRPVGGELERPAAGVPAGAGAADVALLHRFRRSRAQLAAARQLPGVSVGGGRRAYLSHQHGNGASGESGRARSSDTSPPASSCAGPIGPSRRWRSSSASAAISTTGTTRTRCCRSTRSTSPRSIAAIWPGACSPCGRASAS